MVNNETQLTIKSVMLEESVPSISSDNLNIPEIAKLTLSKLPGESREHIDMKSKIEVGTGVRKSHPLANSLPFYQFIELEPSEFNLILKGSNNQFETDILEEGRLEFGKEEGATDNDFHVFFRYDKESQFYMVSKEKNFRS